MNQINIKEYFKTEKEKLRLAVIEHDYEPPSLTIVDATDGDVGNQIYIKKKIEDFDSIWYLDQLTAPESKAILFFKEEREIINDADVDVFYDCDDEQECDWLLDYYENCIVEVDPDGTVSWYEGEF